MDGYTLFWTTLYDAQWTLKTFTLSYQVSLPLHHKTGKVEKVRPLHHKSGKVEKVLQLV